MVLFFISFLNYLKIINLFITGVLSTLWYWNYITIGIISLIYIFKIRIFNFLDFITSTLLSTLCCINGFNLIITPVIFLSFLSSASIFRNYNKEFKFAITLNESLKSIGLGMIVSIIPSILNVIEFKMKGYQLQLPNFHSIYSAFLEALNPAISEEIVFRFFLFAYITNAFNGKISKTLISNLLTYILLIVPHCIMHNEFSPKNFILHPILTTLNLIYMCAVFGVPSVYLIKNKNLQSAIGFHYFCDFTRFMFIKR